VTAAPLLLLLLLLLLLHDALLAPQRTVNSKLTNSFQVCVIHSVTVT